VIASLLGEAGLEVPASLLDAQWYGTPQLTRESRRWSARRVFLVGDATGYVEPFTGEGMSWALAGGHEVCQYAELAISQWSDSLAMQWHQRWRRHVRRHQATCRGLAWLLRRPRMAAATLQAATCAPWLPHWIMQRVAGSTA
jgi:2-polyprenyl-6-methoxyphenol hydroxylase-like FAD-dependent oxidoreductase